MDIDIDIARDIRAPAQARRAVAQLGRRLHPAVLADATLLVSELVSNSVKYGEGPVVALRVQTRGPRRVRVEVVDAGQGFSPASRQETPYPSGGFGLQLVDEIATSWGMRHGDTRVWFEIDRSSDLVAA